jgi:hypothetical protein
MNEVIFERKKLRAYEKISLGKIEALSEFSIDAVDEDVLNDLLTVQITAYIYENTAEERELTYYCEPPTFLDWLFRRKKKAIFKLVVKDLLLDPPKVKDTERIYVVTQEQNDSETVF